MSEAPLQIPHPIHVVEFAGFVASDIEPRKALRGGI